MPDKISIIAIIDDAVEADRCGEKTLRLQVNGEQNFIGYFPDLESAKKAAEDAIDARERLLKNAR